MTIQLGSRYRLGSVIGSGGMGTVYDAADEQGHQYAVKVLRPEYAADPDFLVRFVRERQLLVGVRSPYLVNVHDLVIEGDRHAIVMDLVRGGDLRNELMRSGPLPPTEVARVGFQVAAGLAALHAAGILHLDVKPENILCDRTWMPPRFLLTDLGIAEMTTPGATSYGGRYDGQRYGTPRYVAPEFRAGAPATPACDLYSLGCLLDELGSNGHGGGDPILRGLVCALCSPDPAQRPTASQAAAVLANIAGFGDPGVLRAPVPTRAVQRPLRAPTVPLRLQMLPVQEPIDVLPPVPAAPRRPRRSRFLSAAAVVLTLAAAGATAAAVAGPGLDGLWQSQRAAAATEPAIDNPTRGSDAPSISDAPSGTAGTETAGASARCDVTVAPSPVFHGDLSRQLYGSFVEEVAQAQAALRKAGYPICVDGRFGPQTESAVRSFQRSHGLTDDGVVGPKTWAALVG